MRDLPSFTTKILVPRRRRDVIRRAHLLGQLMEGDAAEIVVVRAPAGFGKTTLLVDMAHEADAHVAWISLDEWDRDASVLVQYLVSSIARALRVQVPSRRSEPRVQLGVAVQLIEESSRNVYLVLDDVHAIEPSGPALELIEYLMQRLPRNCRLFLLSRTRPPLHALPRLVLEARLLELGGNALAFSTDELILYFRAQRQVELTMEQASVLAERTEGWPAAVAALDLEDGELPGGTRLLTDYLAAEIFERLTPELQEFRRQLPSSTCLRNHPVRLSTEARPGCLSGWKEKTFPLRASMGRQKNTGCIRSSEISSV